MNANEEKYLILNKPFVGGYLNKDGHDAHEIINFFKADNGMHFIYNNPYGQYIAKQKKNIKPKVEYVVFTSKLKNGKFYIKYVAEIECELHSATISKKNISDVDTTALCNYIENGIKEIEQVLKDKYGINSLDEIKYDGIPVRELFSDDLKVLPFTFVCRNLYKPKSVIPIDCKNDVFDYNFQRNFGYVSEKTKNPKSYSEMYKHLKNINNEFNKINIKTFKALDSKENKEDLDSLEQDTFLDLISMHKEEESYTKMIGNLVSCDRQLIKSLVDIILKKDKPTRYKNDSKIQSIEDIEGELGYKGKFLFTEYSIENVGRVDLYTEAKNCRLIIENKIDSGINNITRNKEAVDQLNRYYKHFTDESKDDNRSNIFVILVPEYNQKDILVELNNLPNKMNEHWLLLGYSDIYSFLKINEKVILSTKYGKYFKDLLMLSKRHSFDVEKLVQLRLTKNKPYNNAKKNNCTLKVNKYQD